MELIGIILVIFFVFVFLGLAGWILKALGVVFEFLLDGCGSSFGCLLVIGFAILFLLCLI